MGLQLGKDRTFFRNRTQCTRRKALLSATSEVQISSGEPIYPSCCRLPLPMMMMMMMVVMATMLLLLLNADSEKTRCVAGVVSVYNMSRMAGPIQIGNNNVMYVNGGTPAAGHGRTKPAANKPKKQINGK